MWELLGYVALAYLALFLLAVAIHELRYRLTALDDRRAALGPLGAIGLLLAFGVAGAAWLGMWPWWQGALGCLALGLLGLFWVNRAAELYLPLAARLGLSAALVGVMVWAAYLGVMSGWEASGLSQFL